MKAKKKKKNKVIKNKENLMAFLKRQLEDYLAESGNSIARNRHMNKLAGKQPDPSKIKKVVKKFLAYCDRHFKWHGKKMTVGNILYELTRCAKAMGLKKEVRKAIIVDFINFVALKFGGDFGLYTSDI